MLVPIKASLLITSTLGGIIILFNFPQKLKAWGGIARMDLGSMRRSRLLQPSKQPSPISTNPIGSITTWRFLQPLNEYYPILSIALDRGKRTPEIALFSKAPSSINFTPSGISTAPPVPIKRTKCPRLISNCLTDWTVCFSCRPAAQLLWLLMGLGDVATASAIEQPQCGHCIACVLSFPPHLEHFINAIIFFSIRVKSLQRPFHTFSHFFKKRLQRPAGACF